MNYLTDLQAPHQNTQTGSVYREPATTNSCAVCEGNAFARCVRCGRVYCLEHMPADHTMRCIFCEEKFVRSSRGFAEWSGFANKVVLALAPLAVMGMFVGWTWYKGPISFACYVSFFGYCACFATVRLTTGLLGHLKREKFLNEGIGGEPFLLDAVVSVAQTKADDGDQSSRRQVGFKRKRLEPPCAPIEQRTYGH